MFSAILLELIESLVFNPLIEILRCEPIVKIVFHLELLVVCNAHYLLRAKAEQKVRDRVVADHVRPVERRVALDIPEDEQLRNKKVFVEQLEALQTRVNGNQVHEVLALQSETSQVLFFLRVPHQNSLQRRIVVLLHADLDWGLTLIVFLVKIGVQKYLDKLALTLLSHHVLEALTCVIHFLLCFVETHRHRVDLLEPLQCLYTPRPRRSKQHVFSEDISSLKNITLKGEEGFEDGEVIVVAEGVVERHPSLEILERSQFRLFFQEDFDKFCLLVPHCIVEHRLATNRVLVK